MVSTSTKIREYSLKLILEQRIERILNSKTHYRILSAREIFLVAKWIVAMNWISLFDNYESWHMEKGEDKRRSKFKVCLKVVSTVV